MSKLFLKCEEANHVCDKAQYHEASFLEKLKLTLHLLYCSVCRKYSKNNGKLTECIKQSEITVLDDSVKKIMKSNLKKELTKYQD
jgi:SPX domain protein involved in polyphosphate accumulation